jgi:aspartyl/glutamyl-tRNA(Asn/Gln) amidotransferase C subunit
LELTDAQVRESQSRLSAVLGFMQTLAQVDVSSGGGVEEMTSPLALRNVLREDVPSAALQPGSPAQQRMLALAPQPVGPYIGVPKTLEQEG